MKPKDLLLLLACCLVWGINLPLTRWAVQDVPPIFSAGLRFLFLGICLLPFLKPFPKQFGLVFVIAMCIGGIHFALLFLGLEASPASAVAIVGQLGLPIVTVLSVIFLQEKVRWRRILGMSLAFVGVVVIIYRPGTLSLEAGLIYVAASAFVGAVGTIIMKRIEPMSALSLQAWVGVLSFVPLFGLSAFTEENQISSFIAGGPGIWGALAFSVLAVSVFGHSAYYQLLKRYEVTLLAPLTLLTPIVAVVIGIIVLQEPITANLVIGGAITLAGVFMVAIRENRSLPPEAVVRAEIG